MSVRRETEAEGKERKWGSVENLGNDKPHLREPQVNGDSLRYIEQPSVCRHDYWKAVERLKIHKMFR